MGTTGIISREKLKTFSAIIFHFISYIKSTQHSALITQHSALITQHSEL